MDAGGVRVVDLGEAAAVEEDVRAVRGALERALASIKDEGEPDAAKVPEAVQALLAAHERNDVALYLRIAAIQWPDNEAIRKASADLTPG